MNNETWEQLRVSDPEKYKQLTAKRDKLHRNMGLGPVGRKISDLLSSLIILAWFCGLMEYFRIWEDLGIKQLSTELYQEYANLTK